MSAEIHRADWAIPYPEPCNAESIPRLLRPFTLVEHTGEARPWHLTTNGLKLLECPHGCYEYLHLVWFFRARAAMLALQGSILDHTDLFRALSRHRVQFAGIYREHLMFYLHGFLRKHNLAALPECHREHSDSAEEEARLEENRRMLRGVVRTAEIEYLKTLNFISVASTMDEEVSRHTVGFWVGGAEKPKGHDVPVRVRRFEGGYEVRPSAEDVKRMIRAGQPFRKIMVREAEGAADRSQKSVVRSQYGKNGRNGQNGQQHWRVVGDYQVIRMPGVRGEINLATKHKARAFLRFVIQRLTESGAADFYVEEMREAFNAQFSRDVAHRRWVSDRFREDLFRGKEREFDLLFERLDKATGRYRIRE